MWKEKLFLQIQGIQNVYPNVENVIVLPIMKKIGDDNEHPNLTHFTDECYLQVKWWKEKLFLQIQSINIVYPKVENMIVVPITNKMEIIMSIKVSLI